MPDLAELPSQTSVFVDTNIFDLHFRNASVTCSVFIERVARKEIIAYVNTQVLSDLLHKMMLAEAYSKHIIAKPSAAALRKKLATRRMIAGSLVDYQTQFEDTLAIGLKVLRITRKLLIDTKAERRDHGLLCGDSLHLGNMNRHSIPIRDIVTYDSDFTRIRGLTVWQPMDVIAT